MRLDRFDAPGREIPPPHRVALAALLPLPACGIQLLCWSFIAPLSWFLFYPTVFLAPLIGGLVGGIGATALSIALAWVFFFAPRPGAAVDGAHGLVSMLLFAGMGVGFALFHERHRRHSIERIQALATERFRALLDASHDAVTIIDPVSGRFVDCNSAAVRIVGLATREDLLGLAPGDLSPPLQPDGSTSSARARELVNRAAGGEASPFEWMDWRLDGSHEPVFLDVSLSPIAYDGRSCVLAISRDITERKRIERALKESEEQLNLFVVNAPVAIAMFDRDMRYLRFSRRWLTNHGLDGATLAGRCHYDVFPNLPEDWKPAHRRGMAGETVSAREDPFTLDNGNTLWTNWELWPWRAADGSVGGIILFTEDVTQQRAHDERMRNLAQAVDQSPESVVITDLEARIEYVNPAFTVTTGYTLDEVRGRNPRLLQSGRTPRHLYAELWSRLTAGQVWRGEFINRRKDGTELIELATISPVRRADGSIMRYVAVKEDVTQRKLDEARIGFLAHHDTLTSLPNRTLARDRFQMARSFAERAGHRLAVLFLDLDGFKDINDSLGHALGDRFLVAVAGRFRDCLRETDTLSRQGGDEFMVILADIPAPEQVGRIASALIESLRAPFDLDGHSLMASVSIGIALFPDDGDDLDSLMQKADTAMYVAKAGGGSHYRFFDEAFNVAAAEALSTRARLQVALERQELLLHYQPKLDLGSARIVGAEALVRWQSPERGLVAPDRFIPVAEESGLIVPIGEWVLRAACRQMEQWRRRTGNHELTVAVNLSAVQFARGNIEQTVWDALAAADLPPHALELELTESILIRNPAEVLATVERLRAGGVRFSIDDFGTGYSNLAYLRRFPVEKLKIDKGFVAKITQSDSDAEIARVIIQLAHVLGMRAIAEGVEDAVTLDFLRANQCDEVQGYLIARPLPAEDFFTFLAAAEAQRTHGREPPA